MTSDNPLEVIMKHTNEAIDAKMKPFVEMIAGLLQAQVAVIEALHKRGSLSFDEARSAIEGYLAALKSEYQRSQSGETLRRILSGIDAMQGGGRPTLH